MFHPLKLLSESFHSFIFRHRQEHGIYELIISSNKGLEDRLMDDEAEVDRVAELVRLTELLRSL